MKKGSRAAALAGRFYHSRTRDILDRVERLLPPLRAWHRMAYEEHFFRLAKWERMFHGVYPTFAAAAAAIPKGRAVGYDNPGAATFLGQKGPVYAFDYPMLYWLRRLLPDAPATQAGGPSVFDFGGYLGISYFSYQRHLDYARYGPGLRWVVYDVPAVVEEGRRRLAATPGLPHLSFTNDFGQASGADILMAAGSLQFCEEPLAERLQSLPQRPSHLLINKLPVTEGDAFCTLHNMGPALAPYRIFERAEFVRSIEACGYSLEDAWRNPDLGCYIPFHPERTVREFEGMYFRRS